MLLLLPPCASRRLREEADVRHRACDCFGHSLRQQFPLHRRAFRSSVCRAFAFGRPAARRPLFVATSRVQSDAQVCQSSTGELVKVMLLSLVCMQASRSGDGSQSSVPGITCPSTAHPSENITINNALYLDGQILTLTEIWWMLIG